MAAAKTLPTNTHEMNRNKRYWLRLSIVAVLALTLGLGIRSKMKKTGQTHAVNFLTYEAPYSSDPFEYDLIANMIGFTSVHSGLLTRYKAGQYSGVLAKSWLSSEDFKTWRFTIRKDIRFENGDPITPEVVVQSYRRVWRLMNARGSRSGIFEKVANQRDIHEDGDEVIIQLASPLPNLLDLISFGLYSVVHPSSYDSNTDHWNNPRATLASGPYRIERWTNEELVLRLRHDFPKDLIHPNPLDQVKIRWDRPADLKSFDMIVGTSRDRSETRSEKTFFGGAEAYIAYLRCHSWSDEQSVCAKKNQREHFRAQFYAHLESLGLNPIRSFLPLSFPGITELEPQATTGKDREIPESRFAFRPFSGLLSDWTQPVASALMKISEGVGGKFAQTDTPRRKILEEYEPGLKSYSNDFVGLGTNININAPIHSLGFMFQSKEGIRLPDPTGMITQELNQEKPDLIRVNRLIWNDALIWPITHFAAGIWSKDQYDFNLYNRTNPPVAFEWIGTQ